VVKLVKEDVKTKEVLDWKGLHVFHFPFSSCSQKTRIFLNLKGLKWKSHLVDLMANENVQPYYMGINPRGLVPTLVDDGDVHIESNDILTHLEQKYEEPVLIPQDKAALAAELLKLENDLHLDLRALTFRFVFNLPESPKGAAELDAYAQEGSGTVGGKKDSQVDVEINFWKTFASEGVTDEVATRAATNFKRVFSDIDERLAKTPYLLGDSLSAVDIAWFIYTNRLEHAAYPFDRLHPNLWAWYNKLLQREEFANEIVLPPPVAEAVAATRAQHAAEGISLEQVTGI
jgi:glutathione S-transferase